MPEAVVHESYCTAPEVVGHLRAYMSDLAGSSIFGSTKAVEGRVGQLLPITKQAINRACNERDFDYHYQEEVAISGDGESSVLFLGSDAGCMNLTAVETPILENDSSWTNAYWVVINEAAGMVEKRAQGGWVAGGVWSKGVQNIRATCTWGYETLDSIPPEIRDAQAMLTAAAVLGEVSASGSGGVQSTTIGAFTVHYGVTSAYKPTIESWADRIKGVCEFWERPKRLLAVG